MYFYGFLRKKISNFLKDCGLQDVCFVRFTQELSFSLESGHMAPKARATPSRALEGEDLTTSHWEDARHWMSVYAASPPARS
jgi:hypothetical protein